MEKIVVSCLESRIDENQSVYSRFLLGPFLSGHAVTVATALRRALLSEVKNIAITALHIQGVTHEFSTLVGIRESVLELSLNFQQIILSTQTRTRSVQVGYLHVQGPAIVHANDLKLPDGVECVNPTQYIATISTEGLLVVKFLIGEKKSFLKDNTSTLNNKKIKQAKAYSAQLSNSLLSHAEYDPPRLFHLLCASRLPNEVCTANLLSTSSRGRLSEHPKSGPVAGKNNALGGTTNEPLAILQEQTATAARLWRARQTEGLAQAGPQSSVGLTLAMREYVRERITVDGDSKVDNLGNRISDEFNSEICLRTIIPLDPIFTPVYQVNFGIERDDLSNQVRERVIMEVWTNGSIHPRQAVNEAALSIMSIFSKLRKTFQLDSHSLAIPANSIACRPPARSPSVSKAVGLARNSRLYQTKDIVKGESLNSAASESQERFARMAQGKFVNFRKFARAKLAHTRFDLTNPAGLCQTVRFGMLSEEDQRRGSSRSPFLLLPVCAKPSVWRARQRRAAGVSAYSPSCSAKVTAPAGDRAASSALIPLKLKSFSSLGFVRSRHPVALFLQDFGKSHIRGQTFLLEQSFGLKTRFFKGHRAVLSKVKYISEGHTLKRTFLPSFKLVLGPYSLLLGATAPTVSEEGPNRADGRHADRSCFPGKLHFANRAVGPLQGTRQTERFGVVRQPNPKPILFLIKYRTFSFTRNALRVFGCKQEDSSFLLPVTKQLIRFKMARVLSSCLPLMSQRSEPSFIFRVSAPQPRGGRLASCSAKLTAPAARLRRARQTEGLAQAGTGRRRGPNRRFATGWCERESAGSRSFTPDPTDGSVVNDVEFSSAQKRFDSSIPICGLPPLDKIWLRSNLKPERSSGWPRRGLKQFGFLQFAYNALRADNRRDSFINHTFFPDQGGRQRGLLLTRPARDACLSRGVEFVPKAAPADGPARSRKALTRPQDECAKLADGAAGVWRVRQRRAGVGCSPLATAPDCQTEGLAQAGTGRRRGPNRRFGTGRSSAGWEERLLPERSSGWCRRHLERLGVCVNNTAPAARLWRSRRLLAKGEHAKPSVWHRPAPAAGAGQTEGLAQAVSAQVRLVQADYLPRVIAPAARLWQARQTEGLAQADKSKSYARLFGPQAAEPIPETPFEFTTFPLIMAKVPPLSLPSGLVTLLSYPFQYRAGTTPAASRYCPLARHVSKLNAGLVCRRRRLAKFSKLDGRRVLGRVEVTAPAARLRRARQTEGLAQAGCSCSAPLSKKLPERTALPARLWRARQFEGLAQVGSAARLRRARPHARARPTDEQVLRTSERTARVSRGLSKSRCCSTADLFGFNSDGSVRLKPPAGDSCLPLTTHERLSSLYSSNLDKMSFLSSDLANLSLSLKTYTFLKKKGKENIASLLEDSPNTLFSLLNGNEKMFHEIERCLIFLGLPFKEGT